MAFLTPIGAAAWTDNETGPVGAVGAADAASDNELRRRGALPIRVLLVEDNPGDVLLLRQALEGVADGRFALTHVNSLKAGISRLGGDAFDVILLDLSLPDGHGIETVVRVQAQAPQLPVIVLTGLNDDAMAQAAVAAGAQDYLIKGDFDGRILVRAVHYGIQRKRAQGAQFRYQDEATLNAITAAVSRSLQFEEFVEIALTKVLEVTGCEMAHLRLRDAETGEVSLVAHRGLSPEHVDDLLQPRRNPGKLDRVFQTGEVIVGRSEKASRRAKAGDRLIVWTPLRAQGHLIGVLNVSTLRRDAFTDREVELLKAIGNVLGVGLENARLYTETRRHLRQVEALRDISAAAASSLNLRRVLNILIEKISAVLPYSAIAIRLLDGKSGRLRPMASTNVHNEEWQGSEELPGRIGLSQIVFEQKRPLAIRELQKDPRTKRPELFRRQGLVSYLGVPILAQGEGIGVLSIYTKFDHQFPADEVKFLVALANQAGVAIHNSTLFERVSAQAEELRRSNKVKDDFLSVMSHEFRTPLNVIIGYSGLLRDGSLGEINSQQTMALSKIAGHSQDLLGMLTAVLDVTFLDADRLSVTNELVDVGALLDEIKTAPGLIGQNRAMVEWLPMPEPLLIHCDKRKLRQIVEQLVRNAIQFAPEGSVRVAIEVNATERTWSLSVSDTGVGIAAEFQPLIFQKFYQVDSSTTRSCGGLGLGLYISKCFAELLGGTISLQSVVGKGSTFTVSVPINREEQRLSAEL